MKRNETNLPPIWVKVFSYAMMIFLITPFFSIWQISHPESQIGVSAFGLDLKSDTDSLGWMLVVNATLFLAALTGLFIIAKRSFAYDFGIGYGVFTIAVTIPAHFLVGHWDKEAWWNIAVQYPLLGCFLVHLIRNRVAWRKQQGINPVDVAPTGEPTP